MKILIIQRISGVSGSENYYLNLLPEFRKRGISVHFLSILSYKNQSKLNTFKHNLTSEGIVYHEIFSRFDISPLLIYRIQKLLKLHSFDIVQTNLLHADVYGALVRPFLARSTKWISVKHGFSEDLQMQFGLDPSKVSWSKYTLLTKLAGKMADRVVFISRGLFKLYVDSHLIAEDKSVVIPYGFSFKEIINPRSVEDCRFGDKQIIIVGRLVPYKQHRTVIQVLPELAKRFPRLKLIIVGSGPLESELRSFADHAGVADMIVWTGYKTNIHDYIKASDILVVPSTSEGFGIVILEAWHNGKPVVAFDVPAPNEIVEDGVSGVLVPAFDIDALSKKLLTILSNPKLANRMGRAGQIRYQNNYSIKKMVDATLELYEQLISEAKSLPRSS